MNHVTTEELEKFNTILPSGSYINGHLNPEKEDELRRFTELLIPALQDFTKNNPESKKWPISDLIIAAIKAKNALRKKTH